MSRSSRPRAVATPGTCRVCGCTEANPCVGRYVNPEKGEIEQFACAWLDAARTLCTNPRCVAEIPLDELLAMERAA